MRGMNAVSYHARPFQRTSSESGRHAGQKRNAEIHQHALGDFADADVDHGALNTEPGRDQGHEQVGVDRIEQHLKDRVEGHQSRAVFGIALGQVIPHDDHGDAAGEADHDEAHHVLGLVAQKEQRQPGHQHRPHHPVLQQGQAKHALVAEDLAQLFVANLGQRRVHHQDEPDGDGPRRRSRAAGAIQALDGVRKPEAHGDPDPHGHENPQSEVPVDEREASASGHGFLARMKALMTAPSSAESVGVKSPPQHDDAISAASSLL